jgi:hypothetical protein
MADKVASRKAKLWMSISVAPDVCKTPMGGSTPPVPYNVCAEMEPAKGASENVRANQARVHKDEKTVMPETKGDAPGTAKGVVSGTVGAQSWNVEKSSTVNVNGKGVVRDGDKTEMNGDKAAKDKAAKKARYQCRKEQVAAGKASGDPETRAAAERFEKNINAAEKANLAAHTYKPHEPAPTGWRDITHNEDDLARHGLTRADLAGSRPDATRLYEPDPDVFGSDQRPTLGFRGTESGADWGQNFRQGLDRDSSYYRDAVRLGNTLGTSVDYTGHSLGGGLASAAGSAAGGRGVTFNAAGLHRGTVGSYGGTARPADLDAYRVDGEALTGLQQPGIRAFLASPVIATAGALLAPAALGKAHELPATSLDPYHRHLMDDVKSGIERQKAGDQQTIAVNTGKKC